MLKLRHVDRQFQALRQAGDAWKQQGWEAEICYPARAGRWLALSDEEWRWQGWLQPRVWLEKMAPELAALASVSGVEEQAVRLIAASEQPLRWPMPELAYRGLRLGGLIDGSELPAQALLRVATDLGPVWLAKVPSMASPDSASTRLGTLPLPLSFELGRSLISLSLLRSVRLSDMLLIQEAVPRVSCHGRVLGRYQRSDEGIEMEWQTEEERPEDVPAAADVRQLPVRLEFVLQQSMVTLAELQQLCQGRLLPVQTGAELRVEVRANGALLGRGELVQLDGHLGVEIAQWQGEVADVE
ncbi:YscQ/HrcQ family type III secretion apparatus protein [Chromobacterium piscinae]|uniref:YscQ/HrcQ family type III secretion apparatus protein n=1 Tax=Chromobacterium piscinae TaxID=686831 RepID=UPI003207F55F